MSFIQSKSRALREIRIKLFNSRFFTISVLFHLLLVIFLGGTVIMKYTQEPADFTGGDGDSKFVASETIPVKPLDIVQETPTMTPTQNNNTLEAITVNTPTPQTFQIPTVVPAPPTTTIDPSKVAAAPKNLAMGQQLSPAQARKIREFTKDWSKPAKGGGGLGSSIKEREFEFNAYLAKYGDPDDKARGGDWDSTNIIKNKNRPDETISKGSLPNMLFFMNKLSKGKIRANPIPVPLDLSSEDIFVKKPPFIFFTGHRDFKLTDKEVTNLQKYVQVGGCIWGDSSLPGRRSRFDLAFRREMRRVIPDEDKDWEVLPPNYPMFASKNIYYPEASQPQPGVNFYKEPVYALRFGGEVAIIYTANDYGDMWRLALRENEKTKQVEVDDSRYPNSPELIYSDNTIFDRREIYFRGVELPKILSSYKFGFNVIIHLLTRWEDRLKTIPMGL